ncbi:MAG: glycine betaine ABC transporter substrate-binding protein [Oscillospiraceae bacterium]|nr:glycine betaine ABC transporter substrate-binding protein [Oscillospiraceae bacterium]
MKPNQYKAILLLLLCPLLLLAGCSKRSDQVLKLGLDNTAEEAIIGSILQKLIEEHTDITLDVTSDLSGGETVLHPAITSGEIDLYPEYTGTAWLAILKRTDIPDRETLQSELFEAYEQDYQLEWVGLYGFNNSYGIAVAEEIADEYHLETYSDLAAVSQNLTFGAEPGFFEREDGYNGLAKTYGFQFKKTSDITFSLKYDAISQKTVDVINIFTTDGRLTDSGVKVLVDDKGYFPEYRCGTVIRQDALEKFPGLRDTLMLMDGLISDTDMSKMNYQVEVEGKEPEAVAEAFLQEKGLLQ